MTDMTDLMFSLRRVYVNAAGYTARGTYVGVDGRLYFAESADGSLAWKVRGVDRNAAKAAVRRLYPRAKFYR